MELLQPCAYQYRPITCGSFLRGLSRLLLMPLLQKGTGKWLLVWWECTQESEEEKALKGSDF
jgi:hypothetical protein